MHRIPQLAGGPVPTILNWSRTPSARQQSSPFGSKEEFQALMVEAGFVVSHHCVRNRPCPDLAGNHMTRDSQAASDGDQRFDLAEDVRKFRKISGTAENKRDKFICNQLTRSFARNDPAVTWRRI
jgi:hypothetical protein